MKKILTLLFVSLLALSVPANVFADEETTEVTGEQASVELYANIASQYTVKLPARVDVTPESKTFNVFAKGSIAADKQLDITVGNGQHALVDQTTGSNRSFALTVNISDGTFTAANLPLAYDDSIKSIFTVSHAALLAGNYVYQLPIVIALNNAA